ncbi:MAG: Holliday junction resolvase RuvX [Sterolibacterium sp.]|nr:Holliday junction resolvase RuvX [Sterolibacterium sp.]
MPDPATATGTVLAFDFGLRRIGIALGEHLLGQARALTVLHASGQAERFRQIDPLIGEWQPQRLVVGLPRALDGSDHDMTRHCRRFAEQLAIRYRLPVQLVDERFSSAEADARLAADGLDWRTRKQQLDAVAAQIILQDYFDAAHASLAS